MITFNNFFRNSIDNSKINSGPKHFWVALQIWQLKHTNNLDMIKCQSQLCYKSFQAILLSLSFKFHNSNFIMEVKNFFQVIKVCFCVCNLFCLTCFAVIVCYLWRICDWLTRCDWRISWPGRLCVVLMAKIQTGWRRPLKNCKYSKIE